MDIEIMVHINLNLKQILMKIQNDIRKTIVSFNINLLNGMYDIGERISKPTINTKLNRIKNKIIGREKELRKIKLTYDET